MPMDYERTSAQARDQALRLLDTLDLDAVEREIVRELYMSLLGAVVRNRTFWERVEAGAIRPEVIPSAAAMFTAYTNELVRVLRDAEGRGRK